MWEVIYKFSIGVAFATFMIELIVALKVNNTKSNYLYLKFFYLYPLIGIPVSIFLFLDSYHLFPRNMGFIINTISLLFHYIFLSLFIYTITGKSPIFLTIILAFVLPIFILLTFDIKNGSAISFALANGCLLMYSIYYYKCLLDAPPILKLFKDPAFIICCGIFLGAGFIIPFSLVSRYVVTHRFPMKILYQYVIISQMGYLLLNFSFIKALSCSLNRK